MVCRAVTASDEILKALLPPAYYQTLQQRPHVMFGAREGNQELAYMILMQGRMPSNAEVLIVDCIEQDPEKQDAILEELLMYARDTVFAAGVQSISYFWLDYPENMTRTVRSMKKCNFLPVSLHGVDEIYDLHRVGAEENVRKIAELRAQVDSKMLMLDPEDERLKKMLLHEETFGITVSPALYDKRYSRFYMPGGKLSACVIGVRTAKKTLSMPVVYTDGSKDASIVVTVMLAEVIREACQTFPEGSVLMLQSFDSAIEHGCRTLLGAPDRVYHINEYMCINQSTYEKG